MRQNLRWTRAHALAGVLAGALAGALLLGGCSDDSGSSRDPFESVPVCSDQGFAYTGQVDGQAVGAVVVVQSHTFEVTDIGGGGGRLEMPQTPPQLSISFGAPNFEGGSFPARILLTDADGQVIAGNCQDDAGGFPSLARLDVATNYKTGAFVLRNLRPDGSCDSAAVGGEIVGCFELRPEDER